MPEPRRGERRRLLAQSAALAALLAGAGLWPARTLAAWDRAAFGARTLTDAVKALGGAAPQRSKELALDAPDIAENGALVPLGLASRLPGIERMLLLVEKNPSPLSAVFELGDSVAADFSLNLKLAESSTVYLAAMMRDGRVLYTARDIQVTIGGCAA